MPLGSILPLPVFVLVALVGRERELSNRCAAGRELYFGVFAQVADKNDFVDAFSCHERLLNQWPVGWDPWSDLDNIAALIHLAPRIGGQFRNGKKHCPISTRYGRFLKNSCHAELARVRERGNLRQLELLCRE